MVAGPRTACPCFNWGVTQKKKFGDHWSGRWNTLFFASNTEQMLDKILYLAKSAHASHTVAWLENTEKIRRIEFKFSESRVQTGQMEYLVCSVCVRACVCVCFVMSGGEIWGVTLPSLRPACHVQHQSCSFAAVSFQPPFPLSCFHSVI